jgi:hypothetical protein
MNENHHEGIKRLRSYIDGRMIPARYITEANIYELTVINVTTLTHPPRRYPLLIHKHEVDYQR